MDCRPEIDRPIFRISQPQGIDIAGTPGQPVVAGASGKVVYSGKAVARLFDHHQTNKTYLSAYAHIQYW